MDRKNISLRLRANYMGDENRSNSSSLALLCSRARQASEWNAPRR